MSAGPRGGLRAAVAEPPGAAPPLPSAPRFCHQLDFSTSGALCVALNKAAAGSAYKCFKDRLVTKAYLALVSASCCLLLLGFSPCSLLAPPGAAEERVSVLGSPRGLPRPLSLQVRGHVAQSRMTIRYAIGKNTTEGMTHMMCIDGTQGERPARAAPAALTRGATRS